MFKYLNFLDVKNHGLIFDDASCFYLSDRLSREKFRLICPEVLYYRLPGTTTERWVPGLKMLWAIPLPACSRGNSWFVSLGWLLAILPACVRIFLIVSWIILIQGKKFSI